MYTTADTQIDRPEGCRRADDNLCDSPQLGPPTSPHLSSDPGDHKYEDVNLTCVPSEYAYESVADRVKRVQCCSRLNMHVRVMGDVDCELVSYGADWAHRSPCLCLYGLAHGELVDRAGDQVHVSSQSVAPLVALGWNVR